MKTFSENSPNPSARSLSLTYKKLVVVVVTRKSVERNVACGFDARPSNIMLTQFFALFPMDV